MITNVITLSRGFLTFGVIDLFGRYHILDIVFLATIILIYSFCVILFYWSAYLYPFATLLSGIIQNECLFARLGHSFISLTLRATFRDGYGESSDSSR